MQRRGFEALDETRAVGLVYGAIGMAGRAPITAQYRLCYLLNIRYVLYTKAGRRGASQPWGSPYARKNQHVVLFSPNLKLRLLLL